MTDAEARIPNLDSSTPTTWSVPDQEEANLHILLVCNILIDHHLLVLKKKVILKKEGGELNSLAIILV